ncbi:fibronectin type III domain protein [Myxococcus hansupus]|uniref:Fibronectin type III domain protein n=1 Tax=Pseudomyxococcus hansupus TaxID=1297742 RepID=A0A0H4WRA2_9BACT|nr:conserved repeat domain protein [Myxococcus hansupus]AKQ66006.1 fibronectin type III domain protein [Myxococcus hansupus]
MNREFENPNRSLGLCFSALILGTSLMGWVGCSRTDSESSQLSETPEPKWSESSYSSEADGGPCDQDNCPSFRNTAVFPTGMSADAGWFGAPNRRAVGDFTGDRRDGGFDDIVYFGNEGEILLLRGTGDGFVSEGDTLTGLTMALGWFGHPERRLVGDFNADGKDDIAFFANNGDVTIWKSTGNGFVHGGVFPTPFTFADGWFDHPERRATGNFDADGGTDIVYFDADGNVRVWGFGPDGFSQRSETDVALDVDAGWFGHWGRRLVGRFHDEHPGDDIAFFSNDGVVQLWASTAIGFQYVGETETGLTLESGWFSAPGRRLVGDFNGDGLSDFAAFDGSGSIGVWLGTGRGFAYAGSTKSPHGGATWFSAPEQRLAGQFSGDDRTDLAFIDESIHLWRAGHLLLDAPIRSGTQGIVPLHMQESYSNEDVILHMPRIFRSFINGSSASYTDPLIYPQEQKGRYFISTLGSAGAVNAADNEIRTGDFPGTGREEPQKLEFDERSFLHTTDPALLMAVSDGASKIVVTWQHDRRIGRQDPVLGVYGIPSTASAPATYEVHRYVGAVDMSTADWWELVPFSLWQSGIADAPESLLVEDNAPPSVGSTVCYQVKTSQAGLARPYSLPACITHTGSASPTFRLVAANTEVQGGTAVTSHPHWSRLSCPYTDSEGLARYAVTADVSVALRVPSTFNPASYTFKLVRYGLINYQIFGRISDDTTLSVDGSQLASGILRLHAEDREFLTCPMRHVPNGKEAIIYRVEATRHVLGTEIPAGWFPSISEYLSTRFHNRIGDRFWNGDNTNPASSHWQSQMSLVVEEAEVQGYNTIFLDEFRPEKPCINSPKGANHEAPAVEYERFCQNLGQPNAEDAWSLALEKFGLGLQTRHPNMRFIGNAIVHEAPEDPVSARISRGIDTALSEIHGGMFEGCFWSGPEQPLGSTWRAHLDEVADQHQRGKSVLCFPAIHNMYDLEISEKFRLFSLASFLLAYEPLGERMWLGLWDFNPTWAQPVGGPRNYLNEFPEYALRLGDALGPHVAVAGHSEFVRMRSFEHGVVYVNAADTPALISLPNNRVLMKLGLSRIEVGPRCLANNICAGAGSCFGRNEGEFCDHAPAWSNGRVLFEEAASQTLIPPGAGVLLFDKEHFSRVD